MVRVRWGATMDHLQYEVRPTVFSRLHRYVLADDALEITEIAVGNEKDDAPKKQDSWRVPFSDITRIRLSYAPGRYESNRFACQVWSRAPRPARHRNVISMHFRSLGVFEDQATTYVPFVTALCQRVAQNNPQAVVVGGYSRAVYVLGMTLLSLLLLAIAAFIVAEWELVNRGPRLPVRLLLLGSLVLVLLSAFRRNRPRKLTAAALPAELLPKIEAADATTKSPEDRA